jgi:hypothetical protein
LPVIVRYVMRCQYRITPRHTWLAAPEDESISFKAAATMKQRSFASLSFDAKKKRTRREDFLSEMEKVVPWAKLLALIEPHYPKDGRPGRQPTPYATMLRIYFMQQKSAVRAKVEHPFRVIKRQFGYQKTRCRGLAKNTAQIFTLFALSNLWTARWSLLAMTGDVRP